MRPRKEPDDIAVIERAEATTRKRPGAEADSSLLLKKSVTLAGEQLKVAVLLDAAQDGLQFCVYSRRSHFAQKLFVGLDQFKAEQADGLGVEAVLERLVGRLTGSTTSGIAFA